MPDDAAIARLLAECTPPSGIESLERMREQLATKGPSWLEVHFASLPRRVGRARATGGAEVVADGTILAAAWRACDLAAADLLGRALAGSPGDLIATLYFQGDAEERRMILRSLPWLPGADERVRLLHEAHRTNDQVLFEAGLLDSDLPSRILDEDAWNNAVLKVAFCDLPLERILGAERRANAELSRMLLDFMSEREAAGRPAWGPSLELAAVVPCDGVRARVMGDLWHGVDRRRLAAARAAARLRGTEIERVVQERRPRERSDEVRAALDAFGAIDPHRGEG